MCPSVVQELPWARRHEWAEAGRRVKPGAAAADEDCIDAGHRPCLEDDLPGGGDDGDRRRRLFDQDPVLRASTACARSIDRREKLGRPVTVAAPRFVPWAQLQRSALLSNQTIYLGFGRLPDPGTGNGGSSVTDAATLSQTFADPDDRPGPGGDRQWDLAKAEAASWPMPTATYGWKWAIACRGRSVANAAYWNDNLYVVAASDAMRQYRIADRVSSCQVERHRRATCSRLPALLPACLPMARARVSCGCST